MSCTKLFESKVVCESCGKHKPVYVYIRIAHSFMCKNCVLEAERELNDRL